MNGTLGISKDDIQKLIRQRFQNEDEDQVESYELTPLGEGRSGILGEHWILKILSRNLAEELTFFVKSIPKMESMEYYVQHTGILYKEESFYQKILPQLQKVAVDLISDITPTCYMVRKSQFLILEDLIARGFKIYSSLESLSLEAVKVGLITLAKLHACSVIYEETLSKKYGKEYRIIDDFRKELQETFYCNAKPSKELVQSIMKSVPIEIDLFPELYEDVDKEKFEEFILDTWKNMKDYVKPSAKFRNVICHGDVWATNMMYKEEKCVPIECILVDFQMQRYAPPAQDLMLFLHLTTDRAFRSKYMEECSDMYYKKLSEILAEHQIRISNILTKDAFRSSCDYYELFGISQCFSYSHLTKVNSTILKEFFDSPEINKKFMYIDRSDGLIEFCQKDPVYKAKQKECLINFKEAYFKLNNTRLK